MFLPPALAGRTGVNNVVDERVRVVRIVAKGELSLACSYHCKRCTYPAPRNAIHAHAGAGSRKSSQPFGK